MNPNDNRTRQWPAFGEFPHTTGIGSLPHHNVDSAIQHSFQMSVPFLPQIPIRHSAEYMIMQALDGLPGLVDKNEDGLPELDLDQWNHGSHALNQRLSQAFEEAENRDNAFAEFEPRSGAYACWNPFLFELEEKKVKAAKIQLAGPLSCQWSISIPQDETEIKTQIYRLVLAKSMAMVRKLKSIGVTPMFYFDEPGLSLYSASNSLHALAFQELKIGIQTLKKENVFVGLHCCSNTDWDAIFQLDLDVLSIDTGLSLDVLLTHKEKLSEFIEKGGRLSLGIIPTSRTFEKHFLPTPQEIWDLLRNSFKDFPLTQKILNEAFYTPACGLALHGPERAQATVHCLTKFYESRMWAK